MEEEKKKKSRGRPKAICRETGAHVHYAPTKPKRSRQTPSRIVKSSFGVTRYGECRKNQAADIGSTAYDGCGEFVSGTAGEDPLNCAACGCHRSFHFSEAPETVLKISSDEFRKIFCSPYGDRKEACVEEEEGRVKRWKTKFTAEQTEKMRNLAEKLKWKVSPERREEADQFCLEIGVNPKSFRVWMNNHKNSN